MDLEFRRGDRERPRGHALAFFEAPDGRILATYLVVAPIAIDLAKYMPPMFAGQMPSRAVQDATAMPLPPLPEEIAGGVPALERLAGLREDDLIACGALDPSQVDRMLMGAAEAGQRYVALYRAWLERAPEDAPAAIENAPSLDVDEVMFSLMGDHDRVAEIAKLVGKLRYALGTGDQQLADETTGQMARVGNHLGEKYRIAQLIEAAQRPDDRGARLAELHVDRCYKLAAEEYMALGPIETEIRRLSESGSP